MTSEEVIAFQAKEKAFGATPIGAAFFKFRRAFQYACSCDARLEYQDQGEKAARIAWEKADIAEKEFRAVLETMP